MLGITALSLLLWQAASVAGAACYPPPQSASTIIHSETKTSHSSTRISTITFGTSTHHSSTITTHSTKTATHSPVTSKTSTESSTASPSNTASVESCKLPARNDVFLSVGFNYNGDCVPGTGDLKATMIFVDFSDAQAPSNDPPQNLRDELVPDAVDWFKKASNGALTLDVTADTSRYYRMPKPAASYGWENGLTSEQHEAYIQDALDAYMGNGARPAPAQTEVLYVVPTRASGQFLVRSMAYNGRINTRGGVYVAQRTVTFGVDPFVTWGYKALNHETGHTMCLPDYYPYTGGLDTEYYVGGWSIMGLVSGVGPDYFAWDQWRMGWISDRNVECVSKRGTSQHTLSPLEGASGIKAVVVAKSETTALVAEVRVAQGLDSTVCAPGVLLYTVDTTITTGQGPVRVLDATPSSGGCGGGGDLNDATLSLDRDVKSFEVPGWGVKVTLLSQTRAEYKIQVDYV